MRVIFEKFQLLSKIQTLSHKLLPRQTPNHHHCNWHAPKPLCKDFKVILSSSSCSKTTCVFLRNKYGFQIGKGLEKNKLYFDQEEMPKMAWYSMYIGFWTWWFQWHRFWDCTFRCFWVMGYMYILSLKLLIIGLLLEYFATLLKILHLKKTAGKCSILLHQSYFFSWEIQEHLGGIRIKFQLERTKGMVKREYGGRSPKWRLFLQDTNIISQTVNQTNF